ncbi:MAG: GNAT family N-acetyltransferase [Nocardioidaceae bacterium]|nr:GNAT family N-acetyltransferase [Nocardioidaceae bacterium]
MTDRCDLESVETARLRLRRRRVSDARVLHELWTERDPRVPAHRRIDADGRPTEADLAARILEDDGSRPGLLTVERRDDGEVVGCCGLVRTGVATPREPALAFELLRRAQGRGLATEAGEAVVDLAGAAGHDRLWATVWDWNRPSRRVLEKLGFTESRSEIGVAGARTLVMVRALSPRGPARQDGPPSR